MSYTRLLYHIVFRTKHSVPAIEIAHEGELYSYIWGFIKNKDSILYRIGGMPDHIHLLIELSVKLALADFMRYADVGGLSQHEPDGEDGDGRCAKRP